MEIRVCSARNSVSLACAKQQTPQNERLFLLQEGRCFLDQAFSFYSISRQKTSGGLDGSSLATLVQMVAPGIGVTGIPEMAVDVETRSAAVSVVRFEGLEPFHSIGMIWRKSKPLARKLEQIAEIVWLEGNRQRVV